MTILQKTRELVTLLDQISALPETARNGVATYTLTNAINAALTALAADITRPVESGSERKVDDVLPF
jgi:hypothetical protein